MSPAVQTRGPGSGRGGALRSAVTSAPFDFVSASVCLGIRFVRRHAMATTTGAQSGVTLNDAALFRQACYVNGAWVQARTGATIDVDNPATGAILGTVPKL